jgi:RNA-directed DNA polymerase
MLAALEKGVIGGKWYSLIDKVHREPTLRAAFEAVATNRGASGVDHVSIEHYAENLDTNLARLSEALRAGTYRPQAIRRHYIPKPGSQEKRPLGIPTVQDRVVQTALRMVLEPIPRVRLRRPVGMLLAGLCCPKLRLSPQPGMQGRTATGG